MTVHAKPCGFRTHLGNRCAIATFPPPRRLLDSFHTKSRKPRRKLRAAASDAVDFSRPTGLFVLCPTFPKECDKITAQNQHRALVIAGWKSSLDPPAHGIFVSAEQIGDLPYRVVAVDFDEAVIGVTLSHDGYPPLLPSVASPLRFVPGPSFNISLSLAVPGSQEPAHSSG